MTTSIEKIARELDEKIRAQDWQAAQQLANELWGPAQSDPEAARAFALFLARLPGPLLDPTPAQMLIDRWGEDHTILFPAVSSVLDITEAAPIDGPAPRLASQVLELLRSYGGQKDLTKLDPQSQMIYEDLHARALVRTGRDHDTIALQTAEEILKKRPKEARWWFNLGLFHKRRGRFAAAIDCQKKAMEAGGESEAAHWNVAICATALSDGAQAMKAWEALKIPVNQGFDNMPQVPESGRVQVRVSNAGPVASMDVLVEPEYEYLWVQVHSPCHGRIATPTLTDLPVDYHDLVVWDAAPVNFTTIDGQQLPQFPLLAILKTDTTHRYRFTAIQPEASVVEDLADDFPDGMFLYVFEERIQGLCRACARHDGPHTHEPYPGTNPRRVHGKLVIPPEVKLDEAVRLLDEALGKRKDVRFAIPDLYHAAHLPDRAGDDTELQYKLETEN
jgi:tetratricopeptide (TPR) repeat protein